MVITIVSILKWGFSCHQAGLFEGLLPSEQGQNPEPTRKWGIPEIALLLKQILVGNSWCSTFKIFGLQTNSCQSYHSTIYTLQGPQKNRSNNIPPGFRLVDDTREEFVNLGGIWWGYTGSRSVSTFWDSQGCTIYILPFAHPNLHLFLGEKQVWIVHVWLISDQNTS